MGNGHVKFECLSSNICGILGLVPGPRFFRPRFPGTNGRFKCAMGSDSRIWREFIIASLCRDRASLRASRGFSMAVERAQGFGSETIVTLV